MMNKDSVLICPFINCETLTTVPEEPACHLIVAIDHNDRAHIHGPIEPEHLQLMKRMLMEVARYCDIDFGELAKEMQGIYMPERPVALQ
jgi:hypothetical protein